MIRTHSRLGDFMQYRIDIGNGNLLVFEDDNDKTLRVMVVDAKNQDSGMYLGKYNRDDLKRLGRSM